MITTKSMDDNFDDEMPQENAIAVSTGLPVIPKSIKSSIAEEDKLNILLRDQLDCSSIINGIDKETGKAEFKLPLIGLPNFFNDEKINLYYNGNNKVSGVLGVGWSFPVNAIMMDHRGSVFPENEKYFLYLENFPLPLITDPANSTDNVRSFKLSDKKSKTRIRYFKNEERWEVDFMETKQIYGRREGSTDDSIGYELAWKHWRGAGSSPSNQVELPTVWYLTEMRSGEKRAIYYTYDLVDVTVLESGKKFTREAYLKSVRDNEGNEINFKYVTKNSDEYLLPPLKTDDGTYNTAKVQTRYLTGYSLTTYNYRQEVSFVFRVENGIRLLTAIEQDDDPTESPILQFSYAKIQNSHELERVILPTDSSVEFSYETNEDLSDAIEKIDLKCDVQNSYSVDEGQDFVLISYLNSYNHVVLKMFNRELTSEMYSSLSESETTRFPFLGNQSVQFYEVKIFEDAIAVILIYSNSKDICLINKEKGTWSLKPKCHNYDSDAMIQIGDDYLAVLDSRNVLETIVWDKKSSEWTKTKMENSLIENSRNSLIKSSGKVFFIYDDNILSVAYRNKKNEWETKSVVSLPGVISAIKSTLNKFDLHLYIHNVYLHTLKNNAFRISNNLLLVNRWVVKNTKTYSEIDLFTLDSNYNVGIHKTYEVFQDDLTDVTKESEVNVDKIKVSYTLGYKKDGDKFKVFAKALDESSVKKFCEDNEYENCLSEVKRRIQEQLNYDHQKDFILNLQKYIGHFQSAIATIGNEKFTFVGDQWKKEAIPDEKEKLEKWSVPIADKFVLEKENSESSVKLYNQGKKESRKQILDLEFKNTTQIFNVYPDYLVYKTDSEDVNLLFYEPLGNTNVKKFTLPKEEIVSLKSNYNTIITHAGDSSNKKSLTLYLRQLSRIKSKFPNPVIKKLSVTYDNDYKRTTGYDYDPSSVKLLGNTFYYEKTYVIPGDNKFLAGFTEESHMTVDKSGIEEKIYNAEGKLIKIIHEGQSRNDTKKHDTEETESVNNSELYDVTGNLKVAQFYPYEMQDNQVSYYGFEDYEINKIGALNATNHNRWLFNESHVVKQEFSLTGENYLSLNSNVLVGIFEPRDQNQTFVASCWVRSHKKDSPTSSTISPYLTATVYTHDNRTVHGFLSEVKYQYDNWSYLEVVVDLLYSKLVFAGLVAQENLTEVVPTDMPYKIVVSVSPSENSTLDVDHVRFSPLNSDFQATTYNFRTKEIKEIINGNGLIKRYLYNDFKEEILSINENGEIEKFSSYTKASSTHRIVHLKSNIEIQPKGGFYEDFEPLSFVKRWMIGNDQHWEIAPKEIHHKAHYFDQLKLRTVPENLHSYGIRLFYSLKSQSSKVLFNKVLKLQKTGNNAIITFSNKIRPVPVQGELLLMVEGNRLMTWIDGGLYFEEGGLDKLLFNIEMYGKVTLRDVIVFVEPSIQVTYFNALGEKVQQINLESENSAIVTEFLYDELGRQCISTKPTRLLRSESQPVVAYYSDLVTNKNPVSSDSVWKLGRIQGAFEALKPDSFYQTTYDSNPLNDNSAIGLPGQEFSVRGKFAKRFSSRTENGFINNRYPSDMKYKHHVEHKLGRIDHVTVLDKRNKKVASLVTAPGEKHLLATYEYNDDGKLTHMLPPLYHNKAGTPYRIYAKGIDTDQKPLSVAFSYDKMGNVVTKITPDSGKIEYVYNDAGQPKFNLFYSSLNTTDIESVVYFDYDSLGRLSNTGKLISPPAKESLLNLKLTENNTEEYQVFYHSDFERLPKFRGRLKRTITRNDGIPFIEESLLNEDQTISSKRVIAKNAISEDPTAITTNKIYRAGKLIEIEYPANVRGKTFKVNYQYDKLGRIQSIKSPTEERSFVEYTYNSDGLIETEHHVPDRINLNFTRKYSYNSASFLTQLQDKFLTENIYYTEGSYGDRGYGDGTITQTEFEATWLQYADSDKIGLNEHSFTSKQILPEQSKLCFDKLKSAGYINQHNRQAKIYYPVLEINFPKICSEGIYGRQIQSILGKQGFPSKYGHLYSYGAYQELTKAKYFVGGEKPKPLQPDTFAKLPEVDMTTSHDIWKILNKAQFVTSDRVISDDLLKDNDVFKPHGKRGLSIVNSTLSHDLAAASGDSKLYDLVLKNALTFYYSKKLDLSSFKSNLQKSFSEWLLSTTDEVKIQEIEKHSKAIIEMLDQKGYLQNPFNEKFNSSLKKYQSKIPEIVGVLFEHFSKQLGEAEFDLEAYEIDANGNHKHFYSGLERYKLDYRSDSNQISAIKFHSQVLPSSENTEFPVKHDSRGNIVQASHKGIKNITYHPVSNRAASIELVDGKKIIFHYDAQGERVLKRVLDATGKVKKEVSYVRDEFGRSLVEQEVTWSSSNSPPTVLVTIFIYGPSGLVGFIRRDQYYSVITDHEGSIRLVVKNGDVVAAYDYLPYGNLMRQYSSDVDAHISYRYIGQEWDEETGLYNYHTRFYDPSIGRFYQHDPKMQYFSPYKYSGNSPISVIDRNGELAFFVIFLITAFGAVGAYLGGAAVSHNWNPLEWNYKDSRLYLGIIFGGIGGALVPIMMPLTLEAFAALGFGTVKSIIATAVIGTTGAYLGMARSAREWNPAKWHYNDPALWNGAFVGAATFASAPGGFNGAYHIFRGLSTVLSKSAFIVGSAISFAGLNAVRFIGNKYDFSKPDVYYDIIESFIFATDVPMATLAGYRFFKRNIGVLSGQYVKAVDAWFRHRNSFNSFLSAAPKMDIWKSLSKITVGVLVPFLTGAIANAENIESGFDWSQPTTYETLINGALVAGSFSFHFQSPFRKRVLIRKGSIEEIMREFADKSMTKYLEYLQVREFLDKQLNHNRFGELLRARKIPNSKIAVAVTTDGMIVVAYSGWEEPGFVSVFRDNNEWHFYLDENKRIGHLEVTVNDDYSVRYRIEKAFAQRDEKLKQSNYRTYLKEKVKVKSFIEKNLLEPNENLRLNFNEDNLAQMLDEIGSSIKNDGYISSNKAKTTFENILDNAFQEHYAGPITEKVNALKSVNAREPLSADNRILLESIDGYTKTLVHDNPNIQLQAVVIPEVGSANIGPIKGALIKNLNTIKAYKMTETSSLKATATERMWTDLYKNHFKEYDKFVHWAGPNCAEPHCISLLMRTPEVFPALAEVHYVGDIKYLGTFSISQENGISLDGKVRCDNCKITTEDVPNVVTDPDWQLMISSELKSLFKSPFFTYHNVSHGIVNNSTNKKIVDGKRRKRSAPENNINIQDLRTTDETDLTDNHQYISEDSEGRSDYVENGKSADNTRVKTSNFANNLFSWVRTSLNHLFDSKKVLPEKASAPKMLEGIADSKSNLSTATALVDVNSTILLLDTVVRKFTGQKYISGAADNDATLLEARGFSLDVGLAYEKTVTYAASKSGISMHRFNNHYIEIQDKVIDKIMSGRLDEIAEILISHAEKACPPRENGCPGKLSPKKFNKFINEFSKKIDVELHEIMQANKSVKHPY